MRDGGREGIKFDLLVLIGLLGRRDRFSGCVR